MSTRDHYFGIADYEQLYNSDEDEEELGSKKRIISNKMNNPYGFDNTRWFKIVNAHDNSVVEMVENKLYCRAEDPAREAFQTFQSNLKESGHYEIKSQQQNDSEVPMVWDYLSHQKLLIQKKQNRAARRSNQNWVSEAVPGAVSTYFIISAPDCDKCLKNMGVNQQLRVIPKADVGVVGDKAVHWRLVMLEPTQVPLPVSSAPTSSIVVVTPSTPSVPQSVTTTSQPPTAPTATPTTSSSVVPTPPPTTQTVVPVPIPPPSVPSTTSTSTQMVPPPSQAQTLSTPAPVSVVSSAFVNVAVPSSSVIASSLIAPTMTVVAPIMTPIPFTSTPPPLPTLPPPSRVPRVPSTVSTNPSEPTPMDVDPSPPPVSNSPATPTTTSTP